MSSPSIHVFITSSLNNTHLCLITLGNRCLFSKSAGYYEKVKSRRSSAISSFHLSEAAAKTAVSAGLFTCSVFFKGFGKGRNGILRGLTFGGLQVHNIYQVNSLAFNGCRSSKKKRLLLFWVNV